MNVGRTADGRSRREPEGFEAMDRMDDRLCNQTAHAWIGLLLVMISMLLVMTIHALIEESPELLYFDPGPAGLRMLILVTGFYALMPMVTHLVHATRLRPLRWLIVVLGVLSLLYFMAHHASHWTRGERPDFNSHVLDLTHHILALWLIVTSVRWARYSPAKSVPS